MNIFDTTSVDSLKSNHSGNTRIASQGSSNFDKLMESVSKLSEHEKPQPKSEEELKEEEKLKRLESERRKQEMYKILMQKKSSADQEIFSTFMLNSREKGKSLEKQIAAEKSQDS